MHRFLCIRGSIKGRGRGAGIRGQMSPVKFAALVFFEEFNGASRDQGLGIRVQGSGIREQGSPVKFATLVFFEEFNGASREQNSNHGGWGRNEKIDDKRLLPGQAGQAGIRGQGSGIRDQESFYDLSKLSY